MSNIFAFPSGVIQDGYNTGQNPLHEGMTLRDYFAGQALMGMMCSMANPLCYQAALEKARRADIPLHEGLAISAYAHADAMIARRETPCEPQEDAG